MTILGFLIALLGFLKQIWPDKPTIGEKERDTLKDIHAVDTKYQETGDNSNLGRIP